MISLSGHTRACRTSFCHVDDSFVGRRQQKKHCKASTLSRRSGSFLRQTLETVQLSVVREKGRLVQSIVVKSVSADERFAAEQKGDIASESAEEKKFNDLWKNAGVIPGRMPMKLQTFQGEYGTWRGLLTVEDLPAGGLLLAVPSRHVLDVVVESSGDGDSKVAICKLAKKLLEAVRQPDSLWYQYSSLLPKHVESPAFWSAEQISELQSAEAQSHCMAHKAWLENSAKIIDDDSEAAVWALQMVFSRAFIVIREGSVLQILVPFADMFNHSYSSARRRNSKISDLAFWRFHKNYSDGGEGVEMFEVLTASRLSAGQEALIDYGPHTSTEFLIMFGFVPKGNPFDKVQLYSDVQALIDDVDERVPLMRYKEDILHSVSSIERPIWLASGCIPTETVLYILLLHARDREDISLIQNCLEGETGWEAAVSLATRKSGARQLRQRCKALLDAYATTYDEDEELLKSFLSKQAREQQPFDDQAMLRLRLAMEHRMAEKLMFKNGIASCSTIETYKAL